MSNRQTQQRLIAAAVGLVVLIGLFFGVRALQNREPAEPDNPTPQAETLPPLFPEQAEAFAAVTSITITEPGTDNIIVLRQQTDEEAEAAAEAEEEAAEDGEAEDEEDGTEDAAPEEPEVPDQPGIVEPDWVVVELVPEDPLQNSIGVDSDRIRSAVFTLPGITPTRALTDIEAGFADFGLDPPQYIVEFQTDLGGTTELLVGSQTPAGSSYYVQLPGDETVYIVPLFDLETTVNLIEEPPLLTPTTPTAPAEG